MHSCESPAPPAQGAALLLELGTLIIRGRPASPRARRLASDTETATAGPDHDPETDHHQRLLNRKIAAARGNSFTYTPTAEKDDWTKYPSTSKELNPHSASKPQNPFETSAKSSAIGNPSSQKVQDSAVGEAISKAKRALFVDRHLASHVAGLWQEQIPICIEALLAPDCAECFNRFTGVQLDGNGNPSHDKTSGAYESTKDGLLLLERWTLSIYCKRGQDMTITSQWLLNAVRSQLHFSQISAWNVKLQEERKNILEAENKVRQENMEISAKGRQRKLSREMCNFKKLESNCDDHELRHARTPSSEDILKLNVRSLNILYSLKIPGETYKMAEFLKSPTSHVFPITDIGSNVHLKVTLESLPRLDDIPTIKCSCHLLKRRRSRDQGISQTINEDLATRISNLSAGPSTSAKSRDYGYSKVRGMTFSPEVSMINSNMGCSSGMSRKLSIFSTPTGIDSNFATSSRLSTPERWCLNDSGFPESKRSESADSSRKHSCDKKSLQCDYPFFGQNLTLSQPYQMQANYLLVDDRMHTPCSESGKHRCNCDEESDQGKHELNNQMSSNNSSLYSKRFEEQSSFESGKMELDEKRVREIAMYKRKMRKESKLRKLKEADMQSPNTSESSDKGKESYNFIELNAKSSVISLKDGYETMTSTCDCCSSRSNKKYPEVHGYKPCGIDSLTKDDIGQNTSIPILQASKFERLRASLGSFRNQTYLTLQTNTNRSQKCRACDDMASVAKCCVAGKHDSSCREPTSTPCQKVLISISTQTDDSTCDCGEILLDKCLNCFEAMKKKMVRSDASHNLAAVDKSALLLEAIERPCKKSEMISGRDANHKCDNNLKCDIDYNNFKLDLKRNVTSNFNESLTKDNLACKPKKINNVKPLNLDCSNDTFVKEYKSVASDILKRPKLNRNLPVVGKIEKILTERRTQKENITIKTSDSSQNEDFEDAKQGVNCNLSAMDKLLLKNDDFVFGYPPQIENKCLSYTGFDFSRRKNSSTSDDDYVYHETCDYGTFEQRDDYDSHCSDGKETNDVNSEQMDDFETITKRDLQYNDQRKPNTPTKRNFGSSLIINADGSYAGFQYPTDENRKSQEVPSTSEMDKFRYRLDSAASMVFHSKTGLPLTSSPAPLRRGKSCFDYDSSINSISGIKSALFHPAVESDPGCWSPGSSPGSPHCPLPASPSLHPDIVAEGKVRGNTRKLKHGPGGGLLGSFEESALQGRLEPSATVAGFTAEIGASGAFCPPHKRLPVTVFFYALGGNNAPYLGHINLGPRGYRVPRSGTIQVTLFNPHGTVVKMFVVLYELRDMPPRANTFLRQRTLHLPHTAPAAPAATRAHQLRYLIHLRFLTSKTGKLYLHTDIRIIVSRKADLDTATLLNNLTPKLPVRVNQDQKDNKDKHRHKHECNEDKNKFQETNRLKDYQSIGQSENPIFTGCDNLEFEGDENTLQYNVESAKSDQEFMAGKHMNRSQACLQLSKMTDVEVKDVRVTDANETDVKMTDIKVTDVRNDGSNSETVVATANFPREVSYELRSFTYGPENPKYSTR